MTTTLKGGSVLKTVEFEARGIDEFGDAVQVDHYETKQDAEAAGKAMIGGAIVAFVVEKHTAYFPQHMTPRGKEPDTYERESFGGSGVALAAGGWIDEDDSE